MRKAAILAAAALAMSGAVGSTATPTAGANPTPQPSRELMRALPTFRPGSNAVRKATRSGSLRDLTGGYPQGPGWTYAHVKRMAKKARHVARHKAHCKGGSNRAARKSGQGCRA